MEQTSCVLTQSFDEQWLSDVTRDFTVEQRVFFKSVIRWVEPYIAQHALERGQGAIDHAKGVVLILSMLELDAVTMASAVLCYLPIGSLDDDGKPLDDYILTEFGQEVHELLQGLRSLMSVGERTRAFLGDVEQVLDAQKQQEVLRKMLLSMATDLRIVLVRLAARLDRLRWYAKTKVPCPREFAIETHYLYAPLANRLGIWQIKWELEDLSFRFLEPETYHDIASRLEGRRASREMAVNQMIKAIEDALKKANVQGSKVVGRAKHIYSIHKKMQNKQLKFEDLYDLHALRIIVKNERQCYLALSVVHSNWTPVMEEFDDYIARPKPNGYRSLHTVIQNDEGLVFEVQIRTEAMHAFAEHGMAAHWHYKESGAKGGSTQATSLYDRKVAWMRQLLRWQKEVGVVPQDQNDEMLKESLQKKKQALMDSKPVADHSKEKIYVLTPQARVIELPEGATPVDFAYHLHTDLGHRCRGAKVNGQMVALNTPLQNGQTVEIMAIKAGGPSRDWLTPQLGFTKSPRARSKVRAWFNAIEMQNKMDAGQQALERELQKLGKTTIKMDSLANDLGFVKADDLYLAIAKDEFSLRNLQNYFEETVSEEMTHEPLPVVNSPVISSHKGHNGVLIAGVDSLMTQLAKCCHPAPPDEVLGFITRGKGVSVHRRDCASLAILQLKYPERLIEASWHEGVDQLYQVSLLMIAVERPNRLKEVSELLSRMKINVSGMNLLLKQGNVHIHLTLDVHSVEEVKQVMNALNNMSDVLSVKRV